MPLRSLNGVRTSGVSWCDAPSCTCMTSSPVFSLPWSVKIALRPSGVVDFEGRRVDTVTEGMMVEPGQWVRCVDVQANRVVVRPVDKPNLDTLETADFD